MKSAIFVMVLLATVLILSYNIETVSAYSTKTITVLAGSKYTIWTDLNTGDKFQVIISVQGGANNDVDLIVTDPQGKTLVSGRVNQQYSTDIVADVAGRYNFEFDNSFSVVSDKQIAFSYQTVSQSQNPNTPSSNSPQTPATNSNPNPQEHNYYVYTAPLPDYATSYASNVIYDATNAWVTANPNIKFYKADTESQADLDVQWIRDYGTVAGTLGEYVTGTKLIQVGLGDSHCMGTWQPYSTKTVNHIATHEIGHFLGLGHSSDPNDVMYPYTPIEYGQVTTQKSLAAGYVSFIPLCTYKDSTSYSYSVTSDDPSYGFKVYVIPSVNEYDGLKNGLTFNHYSSSGCYGENYHSYSGTCDGISKGAGLLILLDNRQTNDLTQLTITQQEVPFTTSTMQTTTSATVTYNYPSKAEEAQATLQKAITDAQAALQPQLDAAAQARAQAEARAATAAQAQAQAEAQSTADAQARAQAEAQAIAAAQSQALAESQARAAENAKIEAQKQAQAEAEKVKLEAENKIKQVSQAYDKKTFYRGQIDGIKNSLNNTMQSISELKFESSDAKKKIDQAWQEKSLVEQDIQNAENYWLKGSDALNKTDGSLAISYFDNITSSDVSSGNHIHSISNIIDDVKKTEDQYKKSRFCFLWWCW